MIKIPKKDLFDWIDHPSTIQIESTPTKHDCHCHITTYVTRSGGKCWMYNVVYSYSEGIQNYGDIEAFEVKEVEKTVKVWEKI